MESGLSNTDFDREEQLESGQADVKVFIKNYRGVEFEIFKSVYSTINIYESLFDDNVIKGDITILDSGGFDERIPIIGEETIRIEFFNTGFPATKFIGNYIVYKMSEKLISGKQQMYTLYFVSEEFIVNLKTRVSKSYKGIVSSNIVGDIYNNYIMNRIRKTEAKNLFYDEVGNSDGAFFLSHFVFPSIRPFQAINMVANKTVSSALMSNGENTQNFGSFVFFQNQDGFWFKSISDLINPQDTKNDAEYETSIAESTEEKGTDANSLNQDLKDNKNYSRVEKLPTTVGVSIPSASYVIAPQNNQGYSLSSSDVSVSSYKFLSTFDVVSNLAAGMYGSKLLTYDPITQMIGEDTKTFRSPQMSSPKSKKIVKGVQRPYFHEYDYLKEFDNFRHIRENAASDNGQQIGGFPLMSNRHIGLNSPDANFKYKTTNFRHDFKPHLSLIEQIMTGNRSKFKRFDNNVERYILQGNAQKRMMKNIVIDIRIPGDHNRKIGEIIEIKMPSLFFSGEQHSYYRGNYLITKIRHHLSSDGSYVSELQLVKDSLFKQLENADESDSAYAESINTVDGDSEYGTSSVIEEFGPELDIGKTGTKIVRMTDGTVKTVGGL